jgi:hypothetical protein
MIFFRVLRKRTTLFMGLGDEALKPALSMHRGRTLDVFLWIWDDNP